jgi:hypothetical protein
MKKFSCAGNPYQCRTRAIPGAFYLYNNQELYMTRNYYKSQLFTTVFGYHDLCIFAQSALSAADNVAGTIAGSRESLC